MELRNMFVFTMRVERHDFVHENLHDIPLPPEDELRRLYSELVNVNVAKMGAYKSCILLANISKFEPFKSCMYYQAELIKEANRQ